MNKMEKASIFKALGITLVVMGLAFVFFSSYHIDPNTPTDAVLSVIGHYLEGIAMGAVFVTSGILMVVFGMKKS
jgi:heme A synthase